MLGHDLAAALPELRAHAESRMLSTWRIETRVTEYDRTVGENVTITTELFVTKGRLKATRSFGNLTQDAGARTAITVTRELHIPIDSPEVPANAWAVCIAIDPTSDPTILGAEVQFDGPVPGDQATARRMQVKEVVT